MQNTLLNVTYKILSNIILKRLNVYIENIVEQQCGITDKIFVMRKIMGKCQKYNIDALDLMTQTSFGQDTVKSAIYRLKFYGIPQKIIKLTQITLNDNTF